MVVGSLTLTAVTNVTIHNSNSFVECMPLESTNNKKASHLTRIPNSLEILFPVSYSACNSSLFPVERNTTSGYVKGRTIQQHILYRICKLYTPILWLGRLLGPDVWVHCWKRTYCNYSLLHHINTMATRRRFTSNWSGSYRNRTISIS